MVDRTRPTKMVRTPHRTASSGPRRREHRDQRGDGSARREGEGPGGPRPARGRGGPADRGDHLGRRPSVAAQGPRGGGETDGPKSHHPHRPRGGPSLPGSARRSGPSFELWGEIDRGRRGREHRRLDGPSLRHGRGHPLRGREGVHRPFRLPRGGEARMTVRAPKVRATRGERPPDPASLLILHASELLTLAGRPSPRTREAASDLGLIEDGAVYTAGERIVDVGTTSEVLSRHPRASVQLDATGKVVMPGFVDPHAHPVFAGSREHEVEWKSQGLTYAEIAARGGGILQTVRATRDATQAELAKAEAARLRAVGPCGATQAEAKSGYGLRPADELKILRAIVEGRRIAGLDAVPTFLGARGIPSEVDRRSAAFVGPVARGML